MTSVWTLMMERAAAAFRDGNRDDAAVKLAYAAWLGATTQLDVPKEDADRARRGVLEAMDSTTTGAV